MASMRRIWGMDHTFARLARVAALATAITGVVYSVAFVTVVQNGSHAAEWTAATTLTCGGLLAIPVLVAVTTLLGESASAATPARLALVIGGIAAVMTALHGAYDLAALAKPAAATGGDISPVDPRGFATFALAGVAIGVISWVARRDHRFPSWLATVGLVLAVALVATWIGRLAVLDPKSAWLRISTAVAAVLNPVAYVGFAAVFGRSTSALTTRGRNGALGGVDRLHVAP
jgi:hypothetical protein